MYYKVLPLTKHIEQWTTSCTSAILQHKTQLIDSASGFSVCVEELDGTGEWINESMFSSGEQSDEEFTKLFLDLVPWLHSCFFTLSDFMDLFDSGIDGLFLCFGK